MAAAISFLETGTQSVGMRLEAALTTTLLIVAVADADEGRNEGRHAI